MTALQAAGLYVGLLLFVLLGLAFWTGATRLKTKTLVGPGDDPTMVRMSRVHANAVEYVPAYMAALIAIALMDAPAHVIHALGAPFVIARLLHAWGLGRTAGRSLGRFLGAIGSLILFLLAGAACLYYALL